MKWVWFIVDLHHIVRIWVIKMDYPYEASDEASESELLDKSLSMWKGWSTLEGDPSFRPTPLDLHTASSIGLYDCVNAYIAGYTIRSFFLYHFGSIIGRRY